MGRPREFNTDEALEQAMNVFWEKGYDSASLCDLIDAMSISKSSFYETFNSKHDLFLDTIDHYLDTVTRQAIAFLDSDVPGREAIEALFNSILDEAINDEQQRGCYLSNCSGQIAAGDAKVTERVRAGARSFEDAFYRAVVRGQEAGQISSNQDARALARYFVSSVNGLRLTAKSNTDRTALNDIVRVILAPLD